MTILASVNNKTVMPGITPIADVPDTPTIGTATAAGLAASITFTAATTGGTPTTFTATSNPGSLTGTASSSPITVSGLTGDTSYTFTVTAGNSTGTSPASSASNSITAVSPVSGGYDSLATVIVPSGGLSSVVFAGIPTGYKHLQIRFISRSDYAGYADGIKFQFNGDTGSNYSDHSLYGNGSSAGSSADVSAAYIRTYQIAAANSVTNAFGGGFIDILDYANVSKYKTSSMLTAFDNNYAGGGGEINLTSGLWMSTSAITSIKFMVTNGTNFAEYSSFALYGVK
jgi:hypothetical protein